MDGDKETEDADKWTKMMVMKGIYTLVFGPDLLDDSGKILRKNKPHSLIFLVLSHIKMIAFLITVLLFYYFVILPNKSRIGEIKFEIDSFDQTQRNYQMPLDSTNFPLHHVTWLELS